MRGDVSAGLPAPPAALLRASLALPGRPTSQSVTPIAVLHSSLHSIIFIIIHHAASAASRERGIQLHRIFGDERHKTKKQREKKSLRTSGSLQARSQLTKFFLLSFRQAYLPVQVTIMAQGRKMTAAQKAAAKAARETAARNAAAAIGRDAAEGGVCRVGGGHISEMPPRTKARPCAEAATGGERLCC